MDTVTLRGPVNDYAPVGQTFRQAIASTGAIAMEPQGNSFRLPGLPYKVTVDHYRGGGDPWARLEVSIPRLVCGSNVRGASLETTKEAAVYLHEVASEFVTWAVPASQLELNRVDVVHDVSGVVDVNHVLTAMAAVPGTKAGKVRLTISDPRHGGAQSLVRGSRQRWSACLYDKYTEARSQVRRASTPTGSALLARRAEEARQVLRCEVRMRRDVLREKGITTVADLDDETLLNASRRYRQRSGFENPITARGDLQSALKRALAGPEARQVRAVLGQLQMDFLGLEGGANPRSTRQYQATAARWGLTPEMLNDEGGRSFRLDFDRGVFMGEDAADV